MDTSKLCRKKQSAFTLTEMAVVLVILSLLLGGLLIPLSTQQDAKAAAETQTTLDEVRASLLGFAMSNGYFPCAAKSATDGTEDRNTTTGACNTSRGFVPWVSLSTAKADAWGRLLRYAVTPDFANSANKFTSSTTRRITIKSRDINNNLVSLSNANDIPVVIFSQGKNGYLATLESGEKLPDCSNGECPNGNGDEDANDAGNTDAGNAIFIQRQISASTASAGTFDDILVWIAPNALFYRMDSR